MNARVRDSGGRGMKFHDFREWAGAIAASLDSTAPQTGVLARYARHRTGISAIEAAPEHILFDLPHDLIVEEIDGPGGVSVNELIPELATPVGRDGSWRISGLDGRNFDGLISFDIARERYELASEPLQRLGVRDQRIGNQPLSLEGYLNSRQAFRVVAAGDLVYAHGHFTDRFATTPSVIIGAASRSLATPATSIRYRSSIGLNRPVPKGCGQMLSISRRAVAVILAFCALGLTPSAQGRPASTELEGTWDGVLSIGGGRTRDFAAGELWIKFEGENATVKNFLGPEGTKHQVKLDPSASPKHFDLFREGSVDPLLGIYDLK